MTNIDCNAFEQTYTLGVFDPDSIFTPLNKAFEIHAILIYDIENSSHYFDYGKWQKNESGTVINYGPVTIEYNRPIDHTQGCTIKVMVDENTESYTREIVVGFYCGTMRDHRWYLGEIQITQEGRSQSQVTEPAQFVMRARVNGNLHASMAHHDPDGRIVIHDPELDRIMTRLDNSESVTTYICQDGIVDYVTEPELTRALEATE